MTTVAQLIDQCSGMLHSYTGTIEARTYLTSSIGEHDTAISVQHPTRVLQGVIEIEDELILISDVGEDSAEAFPTGRGFQNTTAAPHAVNTIVVNDPLIPRARIFEELTAVIRQCQDLFQVKTTTLQNSPVVNTYEIPEDCRRILRIQYERVGPTEEWPAVYQWTQDWNADTAQFPSGKSVTIDSCVFPGATIQITYAADLPVPTATSDDLETLGIPAEMHDMLRVGTCWRAVQMLAPSRLNLRAVESQTLAQGVTPDSVGKVAQMFFGMFQLRREEEAKRLKLMYPPRKHAVK